MNEQIKLLAEEATRKYDRLGNEIPFPQPDLEVFARLIVIKCLDIVDKKVSGMVGVAAMKEIEEYFGIEE
jgi:hypothetical protein